MRRNSFYLSNIVHHKVLLKSEHVEKDHSSKEASILFITLFLQVKQKCIFTEDCAHASAFPFITHLKPILTILFPSILQKVILYPLPSTTKWLERFYSIFQIKHRTSQAESRNQQSKNFQIVKASQAQLMKERWKLLLNLNS